MINKIKTELLYFSTLLIVLALVMHADLLTSPFERFTLMAQKENYLHPLVWTFLIYFILGLLRLIFKYIFYLKKR